MKIVLIFKLIIINICFLIGMSGYCATYASLSPAVTEIIYALEAQDNLVAVSNMCDYPETVKEKTIIGDTYFANMELIIKLKPDYIFAMPLSNTILSPLSRTKTKPVYFEFESINDIYSAINKIAVLAGKEKNADLLIKSIKYKIEKNKTTNPKKILYIIQTEPFITIGAKSYITDVVEKSGNISVTSNLEYHYPAVNTEYLINTKPDIVIAHPASNADNLKKLFPKTPIIYLKKSQQDIIERPGPRIYEAIRLFSKFSNRED